MSEPSGSSPARFAPRDLALLAAVSLVWGAAYVMIREGLLLGASPLAFASARYALSAAGFAALAAATRERLPARREAVVSAGVGGVLIIGLYGGLLYWGEQYASGGYAAVLASTAPLLTVAFGYGLLRSERLGSLGLAGMGVGFVGAVILVLPQLTGSPIGTWQGPVFVLAAMLSTAVGTVLLRRVGRGRQGLWQIGIQFGIASLLLSGGAVALRLPLTVPAVPGVLLSLVALVLLSSILGYFAYFALHHRVGPVRANVVAYLVPLVGVALGSGAFGEPLTAWEVAGVAVVLGGVTLILLNSARAQPTRR